MAAACPRCLLAFACRSGGRIEPYGHGHATADARGLGAAWRARCRRLYSRCGPTRAQVYALLREGDAPLLVSTEVVDGAYPGPVPRASGRSVVRAHGARSVGPRRAGGTDHRPWLDHGRWPDSAPMALRPGPPVAPNRRNSCWTSISIRSRSGRCGSGLRPPPSAPGVRGETIVRAGDAAWLHAQGHADR